MRETRGEQILIVEKDSAKEGTEKKKKKKNKKVGRTVQLGECKGGLTGKGSSSRVGGEGGEGHQTKKAHGECINLETKKKTGK